MHPHSDTLRISEIFFSLQGESRTMGLPTVFIRLTGCPLRCQYCDTAYAFEGGSVLSLDDILNQVARHTTRDITVTGGEPLAQPNVIPLMRQLCDKGYTVSLETSGAQSVEAVDPRVSKVMDIKTPGSGEMSRNHLPNIDHLTRTDQIKFVLCDRQDYEWARYQMDHLNLPARVDEILFSPSASQLDPATLADWILQDALPVRMQLQLHKVIWGEDARGR